MKKKILISSGGSGGHVIPATIFYDHLKDNFEVLLSTDKRGEKFLNKDKYNTKIINTPKISKNFFLFPLNLILIFFLVFQSIFYIKKKNINILLTTGGYMSFPLCMAAKILNIKIYLFEPNMVIGRANKLFLKFSKKIFCYSKDIKNFPKKFISKIILIEPLIRKDFYSYKKNETISLKKNLNLLIIGGSQGAKSFDMELKNTIIDLSKKYKLKIYQQTSMLNFKNLRNFYIENNIHNHLFCYDENILPIISNANLCITRAGASTLSELTFLNIPYLTIPLKNSKDNHQHENAMFYKNLDCCWILEQDNLNNKDLTNNLINIIENEEDYLIKKKNMHKFSYQNNWNNINQKIINTFNED
jgi:UDP-N-acetylglucosamine--N-acetylmuramyl-(pentapeptide) pyrophosphoryl-undecaprenol N-acetylglucosamine transferase